MYALMGFQDNFFIKFQASITPEHGDQIKELYNRFTECLQCMSLMKAQQQNILKLCDDIEHEMLTIVTDGRLSCVSESKRQSFAASIAVKAFILLYDKEIEAPSSCPDFVETVLRILDLALLIGVPIEGWDIVTAASKLHKILLERSNFNEDCRTLSSDCFVSLHEKENNIPIEANPSLEAFIVHYFEPSHPVKLLNCLNAYSACTKWKNLSYLNIIAGHRTIPIELGDYSRGGKVRLVKLCTYLDELMNGFSAEKIGYMAQHQLLNQEPKLLQDIRIPEYCAVSENEEPVVNCWLGPKDTFSPLHYDPQPNFLAQIVGRKKVTLFSPECTKFLYPRTDHFPNTSQVDLLNPDLDKFPLLQQARSSSCILEPGEMLFIPAGWWHAVQSLDISLSVNFFF